MMTVYLNKDKQEHVYIPGHKQWVQLFKQVIKPIVIPEEGEEIEPIKQWEYEIKQIPWNTDWEEEIEIVDDEEVLLTADQYLYKHFEEVWENEE